MKREIILDTETTGLDPTKGDRVIEVGCIEIMNLVPTGKVFHKRIDPERSVSPETIAITGITDEMLKGQPKFVDIAADLVEFIGDSPIVAHNASFDIKFINSELLRCGFRTYEMSQAVDTVMMARRQAPGAPASLDALCKRFGIDNSNRTFHGALLDAQLLAEVYLELSGGRQPDLVLGEDTSDAQMVDASARPVRAARKFEPSPEELAAHEKFLKDIKEPALA